MDRAENNAVTGSQETSGERFSGLMATVQEARDQAVKAFTHRSPQDVAVWIGQRIETAQYVTNGLQMATQVSEVGGIAQAAINASIDSLEAVKAWIEKNCVSIMPVDENVSVPPEISDEAYHAYVGEDESL